VLLDPTTLGLVDGGCIRIMGGETCGPRVRDGSLIEPPFVWSCVSESHVSVERNDVTWLVMYVYVLHATPFFLPAGQTD